MVQVSCDLPGPDGIYPSVLIQAFASADGSSNANSGFVELQIHTLADARRPVPIFPVPVLRRITADCALQRPLGSRRDLALFGPQGIRDPAHARYLPDFHC